MTDLDFKAIGLKIKERRQELGITQEFISKSLDVNPYSGSVVKTKI